MNTQPSFFSTLPCLKIQSSKRTQTVYTAEILFLAGDISYPFLHLVKGSSLISSKNIGMFESALTQFGFIHLNKSIIVNLSYLHDTCVSNNQRFAIQLANGQWYTYSRRRASK